MSPIRMGLLLLFPLAFNCLACGGEKTTSPKASANRVWLEVVNLSVGSQATDTPTVAPGDHLRVDVMIHNAKGIRAVEIPITYTDPKCSIEDVSFVGGAYAESPAPTVDIDPGPGHVYFAAVPPIGTVVEAGDWLFASLYVYIENDASDGTITLGTGTWVDGAFTRELNFFDPQNEPLEKPDFTAASIAVVRPPVEACSEPNPRPPAVDLPDGGELLLWQTGNGTISGTETDVFTVWLDCHPGYGFATGAYPEANDADIVLTFQIGSWSYTDDQFGPGSWEAATVGHPLFDGKLPIEMVLTVRSKGGVPTAFTIRCDGEGF